MSVVSRRTSASEVQLDSQQATTDVAESKEVQKAPEQKGDVFLKDGALNLEKSNARPSKQTLLGRAKKFLQTLRVASEGKLTFGGRLMVGGVDREASLRNYYPSLKVAKALAEDDMLVAGVQRFTKDVSLPSDLGDLATKAAGAMPSRPAQAEPAKELGAATFAAFPDFHRDDLSRGVSTCGGIALSDTELRTMFDSFYAYRFNAGWFQNAAPDDKVWVLRLYARGKELGLPMLLSAAQLNTIVWPASDESASAMRRLAKAYGFEESALKFAGTTLDEFKPPPQGSSASEPATPRQEPTPGEMPSAPLGGKVVASAEAQKLLAANDPRVFAQDDAGLELLVLKNTSMYNMAFNSRTAIAPQWWAGLFSAWDRAHTIGADTGSASNLQSFLQSYAPASIFSDVATMQSLARLMKRGGVSPSFTTTEGKNLAASPAFAKVWGSLDKVAFGALAPLPTRREPAGLAPEPLTKSTVDFHTWNSKLGARDVSYLDASDQVLAQSGQVGGNYDPTEFHKYCPVPKAVTYVARLIELGSAGSKNNSARFLRAGIFAPYNESSYVVPLVRLAKACGIPPSEIQFTKPDGSTVKLSDHPAFPRPGSSANAAAALKTAMAAFDPASGKSNEERVAALERLVQANDGIEVNEVIASAQQAIEAGKLERIDFKTLSSTDQERAVKALTQDEHLGVSTVFAGLFVDGGADKDLQAKLEGVGFESTQVTASLEQAETLRTLDPKLAATAIADLTDAKPDFLLFPSRLALMAETSLQTSTIDAAFAAAEPLDPCGFVRGLLDRAALGSASEKKTIRDWIRDGVKARTLEQGDVQAAMTGGRHVIVLPDVDAEIDAAVRGVITADLSAQQAAVTALKDAIVKNSSFVNAGDLVTSALGKLYQSDLANVIPLAEADKELGGVAAKAWANDANANAKARTGKRIVISGIEIGVNEDPKKDAKAVPRKEHADMVMTDTTERNLRLIAAEWRRARPVLLEGPTSAGKTSAIRYIAHVTGSPYRRINLSYHTDVSDLLGRYVGGENKYSLADLQKKDDSDLDEIGDVYGLDSGLSKEDKIRQIFDAQKNPRWVDGPIIKAMKKGEVLLLDEVNLARPEVIERLNSLFDDDGNLVLTEHRNEVIAPHKNFRVFATMNPASYAGRARMSEAMKSRWTSLFCHGLNQTDLTKILKAKYSGKVPDAELAKLIAAHDALARAADDGSIGRASGGVAFSLRNLFRVCDRFERYQGGALKDDALMRRETEEIYRGGLFEQEDITAVTDILNTAMPYSGKGFYDDIDVEETATTLTIGDVTIGKLNTAHAFVPGESSKLIMTKRTKEILYRLAKALDCGENVALIGERASGKTAMAKMYAHLIGQPYYRQLISASTDTMQLVGGYDDRGWKDGLLLNAGRPDGTPGMLLLDELNLGSSALLERLNPVLDDERKIVLAEKEGEEIRLHPDFRFIGAMNPPTKGYGGRQKLSKAMQNRLTQIYVPDLNKAEEQKEILRAIAAKKGVPEAVAEAIVDTHQWAAEAYKSGTIGKGLRELDRPVHSVRQLLSALDMVSDFIGERGAGDAFLLAVETYYASTAETADNEAIMKKAQEFAQ